MSVLALPESSPLILNPTLTRRSSDSGLSLAVIVRLERVRYGSGALA